MLDTVKHDAHRVQMFSLEEIWKNIENRLIKLNILIDPLIKAQLAAEDGDESDDLNPKKIDFEKEAAKRSGYFLAKKHNNRDPREKPLKELMSKNDFKVL